MATEFDNSLHWGLFLTGTTLTSETGKYVRVSDLVLSALRAAGVFSNMVDGIVAPATDKLWLDKNFDPAVLKEWDATGASWVPMTYGRLFGRAAVDKLTVTGGTGNAVVVSQPAGFQANRLYLITPTASNSGAATITVSGVGTYAVKYGDGSSIGPTEFTTGRQAVLFFTGLRFEVIFPVSELSSAVLAAQASASNAADSATEAAAARNKAQEWAGKAEDEPVEPGLFSSRHWAEKAKAWALTVYNGMAAWIHGAANKAPPTGADELGIADSANGWTLKRLSLTNLAKWLFTDPVFTSTSADVVRISSTNGAAGPIVNLDRDDAVPKQGTIGGFRLRMLNALGVRKDMAAIFGDAVSVASGTEEMVLYVQIASGGALPVRLAIRQGVVVGAGITGGDKGPGTVNAAGFFVNGLSVVPNGYYPQPYSATLTFNMNNGVDQTTTLAGNPAITAPTNVRVGYPFCLWLVQDGTGGRQPTWDAAFDFGDAGAPVLSSGANQADVLTFKALTTGKLAYLGIRRRVD